MATKVASAFILYALSQALFVAGAKQAAVCPLSTVTSCVDIGPSPPTPTAGQDGCVTIYMPECTGCGCATCSHTHVFTTTLDVFGGLFGSRPSAYTIKEIYRGMSRAPIYPKQTGIPLGFTVAPAVCSTCGFLPITKTMTYPIGGRPVAFTPPSVPRPTKRVEPEPAPNAPMITGAPIRLVVSHEEELEQDEAQPRRQEPEQVQGSVSDTVVVAAAARPDGSSVRWMAVNLLMPLGLLFW
ncbi:hypothetical protein HJFPF1_11452 [Paramyrothecium foliicola]|nr:hypothetical protein HJFPF1_11452 [Paramyrothecium foliicola]